MAMRSAVNALIEAHMSEPKDEWLKVVSAACKLAQIEQALWRTEVERLTKIIKDAGLSTEEVVDPWLTDNAGKSEGLR
jgi:hypothetical protein